MKLFYPPNQPPALGGIRGRQRLLVKWERFREVDFPVNTREVFVFFGSFSYVMDDATSVNGRWLGLTLLRMDARSPSE